ncbi:Hypothetical predicted protein [Marmota monax]|uniref:Uncharacterized protein n=1 Tax=Marmota monax TaxID=9995 RepID=A0A5E4CWU2_MARMO|nr:hypothetical protein GHT09_007863 [Marmota monax]VTJ86297.1 Hypothetical predicted protein [Marmota monax]
MQAFQSKDWKFKHHVYMSHLSFSKTLQVTELTDIKMKGSMDAQRVLFQQVFCYPNSISGMKASKVNGSICSIDLPHSRTVLPVDQSAVAPPHPNPDSRAIKFVKDF